MNMSPLYYDLSHWHQVLIGADYWARSGSLMGYSMSDCRRGYNSFIRRKIRDFWNEKIS